MGGTVKYNANQRSGEDASYRDQDEDPGKYSDPGRDGKNRSGRQDRGDRRGTNAAVVVGAPTGGGGGGRSRQRGSEQGSLRGSDRGDQVDHGGSGGGSLRGAPVVHGSKQGGQGSAAGSRSGG